jgi:hypothetical protein
MYLDKIPISNSTNRTEPDHILRYFGTDGKSDKLKFDPSAQGPWPMGHYLFVGWFHRLSTPISTSMHDDVSKSRADLVFNLSRNEKADLSLSSPPTSLTS